MSVSGTLAYATLLSRAPCLTGVVMHLGWLLLQPLRVYVASLTSESPQYNRFS
jgi:uncharacterized BrkB/YihY/UPF0761 family membrane protein